MSDKDFILCLDSILDSLDFLNSCVADALLTKSTSPLKYSFEVIGDIRRRIKELKKDVLK